MSEHQPTPEGEIIQVTLANGEVLAYSPSRTLIFLHEEESDTGYDHIFTFNSVKDMLQADSKRVGNFTWRGEIGDEFDELVETLIDEGITLIDCESVSKEDQDVYGDTIPKPEPLSDEHEEIARTFGSALSNIPDELFWDNITPETEGPHD